MCSLTMAHCHAFFIHLFKCSMCHTPWLTPSFVYFNCFCIPEVSIPEVSIKWITMGKISVAIQVFRLISLLFSVLPLFFSCPSVKLRVPRDFLTLVCPCLPLQPLLAGWGFPYPLVVPVAPSTAIAGGFFFRRGDLRHAD